MKLVKGKGSPSEGGCWMVVASMYADGTWSDQPACVPPTIRELCIRLNDLCDDGEREELIGPHLFAPMGRDPSPEAEQARAWLCAEWAVRRYALPQPSIRAWAERWLSGQNRSVAAAARAAAAAEARAARAADDKRALLDLILACCAVGKQVPADLDPARVRTVMAEVCGERQGK